MTVNELIAALQALVDRDPENGEAVVGYPEGAEYAGVDAIEIQDVEIRSGSVYDGIRVYSRLIHVFLE